MRIVHVIRSDGWAGVERHVAELSRAQTARGDEVTVLGGDPHQMRRADRCRRCGVSGGRMPDVTRALTRRPGPFDVVNTHMTAADVGAPSRLGTATRSVSTRHFAAARGAERLLRPS